ncbi:DNA-methyltransferase [Qipengyuania flava]|uniref:DNA-methyltransferase n=1 Tax=Qipengyuania flava TaxID=192812 RepID=UPI001CD22868|nr:site-specific DNA-methyltransferase [Qipengyuania flava]MCA0891816.1 site-specific DNA-methyltransferase [Qipengyuania flava]
MIFLTEYANMSNTIADILTSLEKAISTEIVSAKERADNAELALSSLRDGLVKLVGPIANDDQKAEVGKVEPTKSRSAKPSSSELIHYLDENWKSASELRETLGEAGIWPAEGTVYNWFRRLAIEHSTRIESTSKPERWRLITPMSEPRKRKRLPVSRKSQSTKSAAQTSRLITAVMKRPPSKNVINDNQFASDITPMIAGPGFELHQGDCLEVMRKLPSCSVDMVFTSPPYNLGSSSGGGLTTGRNSLWPNSALAKGYASYDDARDPEEYVEWQRNVLSECWRLLRDDGAIFYNHKPRVQKGVLQTPLDLNPDLPVRQIIIWNRNQGFNFNRSFFLPCHEWVVVFAKPAFRLRAGGCAAKDVWTFGPERHNPHPAPFPIELPRRAIENTNARVILDPFAGSGTTGLAALECGRQFVGIDLDAGYLETAAARINDNLTQQAA